MEEVGYQIGAAGLLIYIIVREAFAAIIRAKSKETVAAISEPTLTGREVIKMSRQVAELHHWHSAEDEDGVKRWYSKRSRDELLKEIAETLRDLRGSTDRLLGAIERIQGGGE